MKIYTFLYRLNETLSDHSGKIFSAIFPSASKLQTLQFVHGALSFPDCSRTDPYDPYGNSEL